MRKWLQRVEATICLHRGHLYSATVYIVECTDFDANCIVVNGILTVSETIHSSFYHTKRKNAWQSFRKLITYFKKKTHPITRTLISDRREFSHMFFSHQSSFRLYYMYKRKNLQVQEDARQLAHTSRCDQLPKKRKKTLVDVNKLV